jgi:hypothetical protein
METRLKGNKVVKHAGIWGKSPVTKGGTNTKPLGLGHPFPYMIGEQQGSQSGCGKVSDWKVMREGIRENGPRLFIFLNVTGEI